MYLLFGVGWLWVFGGVWLCVGLGLFGVCGWFWDDDECGGLGLGVLCLSLRMWLLLLWVGFVLGLGV